MLAAPFFDDDAEVDGYASDDEPEDESSGGPPSNRAILVRRGVQRGVGEYDRGFHASSDEESDEKSENMTEASMHQAMDNSRRRDEDSDAEPLFLSSKTTQTTIVIRETVF